MKPSRNRIKPAFVAALVALVALLLIPAAAARTKPGIPIQIVGTDGSEMAGELIAVRPATMIVAVAESGYYEFIPMADIRIVRIPKVSHAAGAFGGFMQGGFYGAIMGDLFSPKGTPRSERRLRALIGGSALGALGAVLGGLKGKPTNKLEVIQIKDQPPAELAAILERLRKMARVKIAD
jgi:hypothetical protein